jgi:formate/nitrite transporter FocA (FNT family)
MATDQRSTTQPPEHESAREHREHEGDDAQHREERAREAEKLDAKTTYEVIRREGEHEPDVQRALSDIAAEAMRPDVWTTLLGAVYAGWLIALMVWMLPGAETNKIPVIVIMTWIIGVAGFAHVIAGGTEVFYVAIRGEASWADALFGFLLPTLVGNVFGGVTLVAALNHAQAEG